MTVSTTSQVRRVRPLGAAAATPSYGSGFRSFGPGTGGTYPGGAYSPYCGTGGRSVSDMTQL